MLDVRLKFMIIFSRFEYALKHSDYCAGKINQDAKPDWDLLAQHVAEQNLYKENPTLKQYVNFILQAPPQKEIRITDGVTFKDAALGGGGEEKEIGVAIRRIRNNLFHGGKEDEDKFNTIRSNELILAAALIINLYLQHFSRIADRFYQSRDCDGIFHDLELITTKEG